MRVGEELPGVLVVLLGDEEEGDLLGRELDLGRHPPLALPLEAVGPGVVDARVVDERGERPERVVKVDPLADLGLDDLPDGRRLRALAVDVPERRAPFADQDVLPEPDPVAAAALDQTAEHVERDLAEADHALRIAQLAQLARGAERRRTRCELPAVEDRHHLRVASGVPRLVGPDVLDELFEAKAPGVCGRRRIRDWTGSLRRLREVHHIVGHVPPVIAAAISHWLPC